MNSDEICVIILDDGMQHWSLWRDLEIVMVNGLMPWGNRQLLPLGPLREPLTALKKADASVIHNADLESDQNINLKNIELGKQEIKNSLPIFFTRMAPPYLFEVGNVNSKIQLTALSNAVVLCVSAIGSANAFVQGLGKLGAYYVDRLDYSDHHVFQVERMLRGRLQEFKSLLKRISRIEMIRVSYHLSNGCAQNHHFDKAMAHPTNHRVSTCMAPWCTTAFEAGAVVVGFGAVGLLMVI
ncbi:hypothetical protein QYF36_000992 [Acer negundo]|nr:hypothetical protein QYF36_000992 [Acer negundo]